MLRLRRVLPWVAVVGLMLQVAIGGVSVSAMALGGEPAGTAVCTCFHGSADHGECPMHHTASGKARCRVRGMDDTASSALATLLAPMAAPVVSTNLLSAAPVTVVSQAVLSLPPAPAFSPDLPPPRS
ncbi:MAG: hypothetical protein ABL971_15720 [Vicinamibacterales bacterium]